MALSFKFKSIQYFRLLCNYASIYSFYPSFPTLFIAIPGPIGYAEYTVLKIISFLESNLYSNTSRLLSLYFSTWVLLLLLGKWFPSVKKIISLIFLFSKTAFGLSSLPWVLSVMETTVHSHIWAESSVLPPLFVESLCLLFWYLLLAVIFQCRMVKIKAMLLLKDFSWESYSKNTPNRR